MHHDSFGEWQSWLGIEEDELPKFSEIDDKKINDIKKTLKNLNFQCRLDTEEGKETIKFYKENNKDLAERFLKSFSNQFSNKYKNININIFLDNNNVVIKLDIEEEYFSRMKPYNNWKLQLNTKYSRNNLFIYLNQRCAYSHIKIGGGLYDPHVTGGLVVQEVSPEDEYKLGRIIDKDTVIDSHFLIQYANYMYDMFNSFLKSFSILSIKS